jgi:hypothetical protein
MKTAKGQLQVWWIPQVPGKPFTVDVATPQEAKKLLTVLANYDIFQFENRIKPDYCNAGGLRQWDGTDWEEWEDEHGNDIDDTEMAELPERAALTEILSEIPAKAKLPLVKKIQEIARTALAP